MEFCSSGTPRFPPLASNYERRRFERGIKIDVFCLEAKSLCFPNAPRVRIDSGGGSSLTTQALGKPFNAPGSYV